MGRGQCITSGLGEMSMVEYIGTEISGLEVDYLTLPTFAYSIIVHMTFIDISCSMFVYLILENIITSPVILTKANDEINSSSD